MSFYDRFEQLCKEKGTTPTSAAHENGISQPAVSMWKTRGSTPQATTVRKLAHYFGVTVEYLLDIKPAHAVNPNETEAEREKCLGLPEGALSNAPKAEDVEARNKADMMEAMDKLNISGQQEAVKRVREMASIDQYKRHSFEEIWGYSKPPQKDAPKQK